MYILALTNIFIAEYFFLLTQSLCFVDKPTCTVVPIEYLRALLVFVAALLDAEPLVAPQQRVLARSLLISFGSKPNTSNHVYYLYVANQTRSKKSFYLYCT
jgi:hypothetical protein